jgi:hypothetical protein
MKNKKSPELLNMLAEQKFCSMIRHAGEEWSRRLRLAEGFGRRERFREIQFVQDQCLEVRQLLESLPTSIGRLISEHSVREFADIITAYDDITGRSRLGILVGRRHHEDVCLSMLRAVHLPCVLECNIKEIRSEFMQELLSLSIQTNPHVARLILPLEPSIKLSRFVLKNLHRLTVLQEFRFETGCNTDVVIELGRHCTLLKILDIRSSVDVDDDCIEYLLNLQSLEKLHVAGTDISHTCYALLLSNLPRIQNITWCGQVDNILQNITKECLPSVNEFSGGVSNASLVTQICPRIKDLSIYLHNENALDLIQLTDVVSLSLTRCDYNINKLNVVFENMGIRLTKLDVFLVENFNISHIISCCSILKILIVRFCGVILSENFIFASELTHFKSVKEVTLKSNSDFRNSHKYLSHCVNLEVFKAECVEEIDDVAVSEILNAGGFRKLSESVFSDCGPLCLETAMLMIKQCDNLSVLGNLNTWSGVTDDDKKLLFDCVKTNNLALTVKL